MNSISDFKSTMLELKILIYFYLKNFFYILRRATTGSVSSTSSDLYLDAPPPAVQQQPVTSTPSGESLAVSAQAANSGGEKSGQLRWANWMRLNEAAPCFCTLTEEK